MTLLKQLQEASVFQPPSKADVSKRKEDRQKLFGKGIWKAEAYHKRAYLELDSKDKQALDMLFYDFLVKHIGEHGPAAFTAPIEYVTKASSTVSADQCSGSITAPNGEEFDMDVNWEVLAEEVEPGVVISGVIESGIELSDEDIEAIKKMKSGAEVEEHFSGTLDLMYDIESDAMQKYYTKEGPARFKEWLEEQGGDSPDIKVTGPIEVKYVGEEPQIG